MTTSPNLVVTPSAHPLSDAERARAANPAFGRIFTDHMVVIPYRDGKWQQGELKAYGPLMLDPSASSLHYGQAIFEGYKAFARPMAASRRCVQNKTRNASTAAPRAWPCPPFPSNCSWKRATR
jgi:branched-chain amino acid aminotransferase